jgi:hypothetical protein
MAQRKDDVHVAIQDDNMVGAERRRYGQAYTYTNKQTYKHDDHITKKGNVRSHKQDTRLWDNNALSEGRMGTRGSIPKKTRNIFITYSSPWQ